MSRWKRGKAALGAKLAQATLDKEPTEGDNPAARKKALSRLGLAEAEKENWAAAASALVEATQLGADRGNVWWALGRSHLMLYRGGAGLSDAAQRLAGAHAALQVSHASSRATRR